MIIKKMFKNLVTTSVFPFACMMSPKMFFYAPIFGSVDDNYLDDGSETENAN